MTASNIGKTRMWHFSALSGLLAVQIVFASFCVFFAGLV